MRYLRILPSVRNASRPRALSVSLPIDLVSLQRMGLRILNTTASTLPMNERRDGVYWSDILTTATYLFPVIHDKGIRYYK